MADIVSERYALSLYEVAAEDGKAKAFLDELTAVCEVFKREPDFLKMLTTPSIGLEDKHKVLRTVLEGKIEPFLLNFLMLITEKGRVGLIHDMREAYKEHYYFENGIVEVRAITAKPLSAALTDKLKSKMSAVTGKQVVLETSVDENLLGGIVVKLGNEQFDTSLRTRLHEIAARLTNTIA
ncbi:ATP synthase F1 subunit delta [Agathobaculum desmolans]|uniref:ATP synthase F1 subunit delta n=1 Tax=Agathobaculum desmolans TaxID=39484 RepID=UPI0004E1D609|nr:ATP synthase F1 subunit delta [Agathobaculum desmolans]